MTAEPADHGDRFRPRRRRDPEEDSHGVPAYAADDGAGEKHCFSPGGSLWLVASSSRCCLTRTSGQTDHRARISCPFQSDGNRLYALDVPGVFVCPRLLACRLLECNTRESPRARQRRHRRHIRLVPVASRARGRSHRSSGRRRSRDELRQCRRDLARIRFTLGWARHASQGAEVALPATCSAGRAPTARPDDVDLDPQDAAQLHFAALCAQQEPHGAPRGVQPRRAAQTSRRNRHRLRRTLARHAATVSHAETARRRGGRHRRAQETRHSLRIAGPGRLHRRRTRTCRRAADHRRRSAPAG